jgi:hypothetical protein
MPNQKYTIQIRFSSQVTYSSFSTLNSIGALKSREALISAIGASQTVCIQIILSHGEFNQPQNSLAQAV